MCFYFQTGDILAFAGRGWVSRRIALQTCTPCQLLRGRWISHVGICAAVDSRSEAYLFESTTMVDEPCAITGNRIDGVQAHWPDRRVAKCEGKVWLLRTRKHLAAAVRRRLGRFLQSCLGTPYDVPQALLSGTWLLNLTEFDAEDTSKLFCSEYVRLALEDAGIVADTNASIWTPARLVRELVQIGLYQITRIK